MGTDVNPVAWENAEITANLLVDIYNTSIIESAIVFKDGFLKFGSYLDRKHGEFTVNFNDDAVNFTIGNHSYSYKKSEHSKEAIVKTLYETFYKHQI